MKIWPAVHVKEYDKEQQLQTLSLRLGELTCVNERGLLGPSRNDDNQQDHEAKGHKIKLVMPRLYCEAF